MIKQGLNGILVNPNENEIGITNALIKLITDNELRKKFSSESSLLKDKYSVKNIMKIGDNFIYRCHVAKSFPKFMFRQFIHCRNVGSHY